MAPALFWSIKFERRVKKWPEPKKLLKQKINFFISINYAKEFLNSLHTGVVFSELFSRASNGCHYSRSWNFQLKISSCNVFQHAEFKFHGCSWIWDYGLALFLTWLNSLSAHKSLYRDMFCYFLRVPRMRQNKFHGKSICYFDDFFSEKS